MTSTAGPPIISLTELHELFRTEDPGEEDEIFGLLASSSPLSNEATTDVTSAMMVRAAEEELGVNSKGCSAPAASKSNDADAAYAQQTADMDAACEAYIEAHVQNADRIAKLYCEYTACEERVVDFETEIVHFQRQLKETESIVAMQQQIDDLLLRIKHRQQVSASLNEVYSALQECDAFCQAVSGNHPVDDAYLSKLRRLGVKLTFLSRHRALQRSAVDDEIRPKLTAAAEQAGEKLYRYIASQIYRIPVPGSPHQPGESVVAGGSAFKDMDALHVSLEQGESFGFTFLKLYNPPVAKRIVILYVQQAVAYYNHKLNKLLQGFAQLSARCGAISNSGASSSLSSSTVLGYTPVLTTCLTSLVVQKALEEWRSGKGGCCLGNSIKQQQQHPATSSSTNRSGSVTSSSNSSISSPAVRVDGSQKFTSSTTSHPFERIVKNADAVVYMKVLNAIQMKYGNLKYENPRDVRGSHPALSWLPSFIQTFLFIVNACISECRFIGSFFCVAETQEGAVENYNDAEQVSKLILDPLIARVQKAMEDHLLSIGSRMDLLSAIRVIELCKEVVCTLQDPIPLLLLSSLMEISKAVLRSRLQSLLRKDLQALEQCVSLTRSALSSPSSISAARRFGDVPSFLPAVMEVIWAVDLLNTNAIRASTFRVSVPKVCDSNTDKFCVNASQQVLQLMHELFQYVCVSTPPSPNLTPPTHAAGGSDLTASTTASPPFPLRWSVEGNIQFFSLLALHQCCAVLRHRVDPNTGEVVEKRESRQCGGGSTRLWEEVVSKAIWSWLGGGDGGTEKTLSSFSSNRTTAAWPADATIPPYPAAIVTSPPAASLGGADHASNAVAVVGAATAPCIWALCSWWWRDHQHPFSAGTPTHSLATSSAASSFHPKHVDPTATTATNETETETEKKESMARLRAALREMYAALRQVEVAEAEKKKNRRRMKQGHTQEDDEEEEEKAEDKQQEAEEYREGLRAGGDAMADERRLAHTGEARWQWELRNVMWCLSEIARWDERIAHFGFYSSLPAVVLRQLVETLAEILQVYPDMGTEEIDHATASAELKASSPATAETEGATPLVDTDEGQGAHQANRNEMDACDARLSVELLWGFWKALFSAGE